MEINKIYNGDCLDVMSNFPDKSIDCVITSPPYWQMRNYGWDGQWGLESTFEEYLINLWKLMDEISRVLKECGSVWINLGDSYSTVSGGMRTGTTGKVSEKNRLANRIVQQKPEGITDKCLLLLPHRFAIGCIDRKWIVRNTIIWGKPNGMPESVTDRFSKKHEYIFLMVKNIKYYFDLDAIRDIHKWEHTDKRSLISGGSKSGGKCVSGNYSTSNVSYNKMGKNPGDVSDFWAITTKPNMTNHFATFNTNLIDKPIIAGCPRNGIILDPFCGTGTTLFRAKELGRNFIGIEGNKEYIKIAEERLKQEYLSFNEEL